MEQDDTRTAGREAPEPFVFQQSGGVIVARNLWDVAPEEWTLAEASDLLRERDDLRESLRWALRCMRLGCCPGSTEEFRNAYRLAGLDLRIGDLASG